MPPQHDVAAKSAKDDIHAEAANMPCVHRALPREPQQISVRESILSLTDIALGLLSKFIASFSLT